MRPKPHEPRGGFSFVGRFFFRGPERLRNRPKVTQGAGRAGGRREAGGGVALVLPGPPAPGSSSRNEGSRPRQAHSPEPGTFQC